jgi:hypothetical protein
LGAKVGSVFNATDYRILEPTGSVIERLGGADRDRTDDLLIANEALYQLSYSPKPRRGRFRELSGGE